MIDSGRCWLRVVCVAALFIAGLGVASGQALSGLLPVNKAFKADARVGRPGLVSLHWTIAPHYYLYRSQIKVVGSKQEALGSLNLPRGQKVLDSFFGSVEVYRGDVQGSLRYTLSSNIPILQLSVSYRGCHEVSPVVCFPAQTQTFELKIPTAGASGTHETANAIQATRPSAGIAALAPASVAGAQTAQIFHEASDRGMVGLLTALLFAFAGGLVLNVMPCVLPVLAMKVTALVEHGSGARSGRGHPFAYTGGVLTTFLTIGGIILVLRSLGFALGWGAQLQHPVIVAILALVMVAVGLSMSGVVHFGSNFGNVGHGLAGRSGWVGDFFTGVLAVVVASPCVAPFMGAALAFAFVAPAIEGLLTFFALGVGFALPFLLIAVIPGFDRLVPKPGAWMVTLKQVLAFPMYLTAVWLVWVLAHQSGPDAVGLVLASSVVLTGALWWFERARRSGVARQVAPVILAIVAMTPVYLVSRLQPTATVVAAPSSTREIPFSPEKLAALRQAGTPVFVNMTADWCITCQANEHTVLDTATFHKLLETTGAVYMVGDWTDQNPKITAFLQKYHSPGVPLYVVFPKGGGPGKILPTVLTASLVRDAFLIAAR